MRKKHKYNIISVEDQEEFRELGRIANKHLYENNKRVANALDDALEKLAPLFEQCKLEDRGELLCEFGDIIDFEDDDWFDELMIACLNTGQYERGLYICDRLEKSGVFEKDTLAKDRAHFLARSGRTKDAERLLKDLLEQNEDDLSLYIALGDIYYTYQAQEEKYDLEKAEQWYYKAYDKCLAGSDSEDRIMLLERLGAACVERLRKDKEEELLRLMQGANVGGWETLAQLRKEVYFRGTDSVIFDHLQTRLGHVDNIEEANRRIHILSDAYNFMPQQRLDHMSPFEMTINFPKGEHTVRIQKEMIEAFEKSKEGIDPHAKVDARFFEEFSEFQQNFLSQNDPQTRKTRGKLIEQELKEAQKECEEGEKIWMGFLDFRRKL